MVHLYEQQDGEFVNRFQERFAFALWDSRRERLMLPRDRVGQKPLYYTRDSDRVLFGSELKGIPGRSGGRHWYRPESGEDCLTFGGVSGERSIFNDIHKLPSPDDLVISRESWNVAPEGYCEVDVAGRGRRGREWVAGIFFWDVLVEQSRSIFEAH